MEITIIDEAASVNIEDIEPVENDGRYVGLYLSFPSVRLKSPEEFERDD